MPSGGIFNGIALLAIHRAWFSASNLHAAPTGHTAQTPPRPAIKPESRHVQVVQSRAGQVRSWRIVEDAVRADVAEHAHGLSGRIGVKVECETIRQVDASFPDAGHALYLLNLQRGMTGVVSKQLKDFDRFFLYVRGSNAYACLKRRERR
jgi:hypothetical protein